MSYCTQCGAAIPDGARFCPACGTAAGGPPEATATFGGGHAPTSTPTSARRIRSEPGSAAAFTPGQVLAGRYRIIGLLGRGGMGEVYRADDLKLGTAVALKFLPRGAERDPAALERFHAEVRNARQVSHPHVCRVYDIGEVEGRHFLCMEYVDGEDLSTLLRRIGRLPPAKAVEIARQIAAGLAAAHEKGVLHRDLKPANVMLDGHGRARITDFGLAVLADEAGGEIAGTPAYMSPEQLAGLPATVQSDLYALGLVLYEIFTGKRAFEAEGLAGWKRVHCDSPPTSPSHHTTDIDPAVERLILRCLEKEPGARPRSAAQVALALPGGDPLAAALAAGETPSPEMVAAAGGEGALSPARAWLALGGFVALLVAVIGLSPASTDLGLAPMDRSPDVLRTRAREIVRSLGHEGPWADEASWLERDYGRLRWLADHVPSVDWRRDLARGGSPVLLRLRLGREELVPRNPEGAVTSDDPPANRPGEIEVAVDARGRLRELLVAPPRSVPERDVLPAFPEGPIFEAAELERARFVPIAAERVPPVPFDERREWVGSSADAPDVPLRVGAATLDGSVVAFRVAGPWNADDPLAAVEGSTSRRISRNTVATVVFLVLVTTAFFARRNLRSGRGDRRGAFRLACVGAALSLLRWIAVVHPSSLWDALLFGQLLPALAQVVFSGALLWVTYVAFEPYVRRRMPGILVGWARLLEGRFLDPRVCRDALFGLAGGGAVGFLLHLSNALPTWFPFAAQTTIPLFVFGGVGADGERLEPIGSAFEIAFVALLRPFTLLALLFVCRLVVSRTWIVLVLLWLVVAAMSLGGENPVIETPTALLVGLIFSLTVVRIGLLGVIAAWLVVSTLAGMPLGIGLGTWYAPYSIGSLLVLLALAGWAFYGSLGGRSPFGDLDA